MSPPSAPGPSYQAAAIEASQRGDQKVAVDLATREVLRFASPDQCSPTTSYNCGTLALAYGSLAEYQILNGEMVAGEGSFMQAQDALKRTDSANRSSATAMVYRDVSEAFWKIGNRERAIEVFKAGRAAGGDNWLLMSAAGEAVRGEAPIGTRCVVSSV